MTPDKEEHYGLWGLNLPQDEVVEEDLFGLYQDDPQSTKIKKANRITAAILVVLLLVIVGCGVWAVIPSV